MKKVKRSKLKYYNNDNVMKLLDSHIRYLNVICVLNVILLLNSEHAIVRAETFTIGYLTGSQRKPGDMEYDRPGKYKGKKIFL